MQAATTFRIDGDPLPDESHWQSMRSAEDHLTEILQGMRGLYDLAAGEPDTEAAQQVLTDEGYTATTCTHENAASFSDDLLTSYALEIEAARWESDHAGRLKDFDCAPLARVVVTLGTGGPHVELDISCDSGGEPARVTLNRYWSGSNGATTTDSRALEIVERFLPLVGVSL